MSTRRKRRVARGLAASVPVALLGIAITRMFGILGAAAFLLLALIVLGGFEVLFRDEADDTPRLEVRRSFWVGLLWPTGLGLLFVAERVVGEGHALQLWWRVLAAVTIGAALAWRGWQLSRATGNQRAVEVRLAIATGGLLVALALYALSTDAGVAMLGWTGEAAERGSGALGVLWVVVMIVSGGALFFMEMAYRVMPVEEAVELRRVSAAAGTGLTLALSLVFVASIDFVAAERDVVRDLSYFKTTRPSETSVHMVERLDEPVRVVLLYPPVSEVLDQVRPFFEELDRASSQLSVEVRDHALARELVSRHQVRGNGFVLLVRGEGEGETAERFEIGMELDTARQRLRTLDGRFQESFARLTRRPRELHLTTGHRERSASGAEGDPPEQRLGELAAALTRSNIQSRDLGVAQGLATRVPEEARAVAVIGPRERFLPEEAESLLEYVAHGGRLLVFLDPDVDHGLDPLLTGLGLAMREGVLHSEQSHLRRAQPPADRELIFSNQYSAHPTVTLANRYRSRVATVFARGGALERTEGPDELEGATVTFPIRTGEGFWLDVDDDHERDEGEVTEPRFYVMAAVTVPRAGGDEGRAVVVADGDFITDAWIGNRGNGFVLMDSVSWLVGEEQILGPTQTEEDVPIRHTREEDEAWFYGTSFGAPLPLLLIGGWLARRRRRGGERREPRRKKAPAAMDTPQNAPLPSGEGLGRGPDASPADTHEDAEEE